MKEFLQQNEYPQNQVAKNKLVQLKQVLQTDEQYIFQLMMWGIENLDLDEKRFPDMDFIIVRLATQKDQESAFQLIEGPGPDEVFYHPEELEEMDPEEAAFRLIESLRDNWIAANPYT